VLLASSRLRRLDSRRLELMALHFDGDDRGSGEPAAHGHQRMRSLSWQDFGEAVERIAQLCGDRRFSGIHGIPRGGLVLAVALSHRLDLPLLPVAQPGCLVVDDVIETGRTLAPYRQLVGAERVVWISKLEPLWWQAVEVTASTEWILFPWEHAERAAADERLYRQERDQG
jgi:hypoxanthine phosphoribosyltransferase